MPVQQADPIGAKLAPDELDLSTGELAVPEAAAQAVKDGGDLDVKVRLPGLAEGTLRVRKRAETFTTVGGAQGIVFRHPSLLRFAAASPMVLALDVKDSKVSGWVGLGAPGPVKSARSALGPALVKGADLLGWAGLSKIVLPTVRNRFEGGALDVGVDDLAFTVGGFLSGTGAFSIDNKGLAFAGSAKVAIPGGSAGELQINRDPTGALAGKLDLLVAIGSVTGTVTATLARGFVSVMGSVAYVSDRLSGKVTLVATDEATARDITLKKPDGGGDVPIELPGPDTPGKPGPRAFCGWGQLTFRVNEWLAGTAAVIVNSKGQATIVGEIAPPKEIVLFEQKEWIKHLFKVEIRAGYGIPVVGQVGLFANIGLDAIAKVGPGKLYNIKLAGAYSTDPRVPRQLSLEATINISAFAGLRLRAEAGLVVTIIGHDIKAGVALDAYAGVRGYVEATPRIGMREPVPGKREYYIQGHMEIAAQPVLGFGGELFVAIETPWWSPLSDKRWTWPLFSIEYPLPGEFGIGADVDYVLGSKKWPSIEFGEVNFDSSKFLTDVMNDNTDSGHGGEEKKPGDWKEGLGGQKSSAKNKGGSGKTPQDPDDDIGPIGDESSFSDGEESHRLWVAEKPSDAKLMLASEQGEARAQLKKIEKNKDELLDEDVSTVQGLIRSADKQVATWDKLADDLAHKKEAARNAKAYYKRHGNKKKKGDKAAKKDIKKLKKDVRDAQKAAGATIQKLLKLMAKKPFEPITRTPKMHGGTDLVEIVSEKTHAGLRVAKKKEDQKLKDLVSSAAPLVAHAAVKVGQTYVKERGERLKDLTKKINKGRIKAGKVNLRVHKWLEGLADAGERIVAGMGERMQIENLERARKFVKLDLGTKGVLKFPAKPASPGKELFRRAFMKEMRRQLRDQQTGMNNLSADEWLANRAKFSMDEKAFKAFDKAGRLELADELIERGKKAEQRAQKTKAILNKQIDALLTKDLASDKVLQELQERLESLLRAIDREAAAREGQTALAKTKATGGVFVPEKAMLKPNFEGTDKEMQLRIIGRQGAERKKRDEIREHLDRLIRREKDWALLANVAKEVAILHRPDGVGGGYDRFEKLPDVPTREDDDAGWKTYLDALKKMIGPQNVNSWIGKFWSKLITDLAPVLKKAAAPPISYPIHRMQLKLETDP